MTDKRKPGYYWVRGSEVAGIIKNVWLIAEYTQTSQPSGGFWELTGTSELFTDAFWQEIDPVPIERNNKIQNG